MKLKNKTTTDSAFNKVHIVPKMNFPKGHHIKENRYVIHPKALLKIHAERRRQALSK